MSSAAGRADRTGRAAGRAVAAEPMPLWQRAWPAALVGLVAVALYLPTTQFGFLNWDDNINFTDNQYYYPPSAQNLWKLWKEPLHSLYIPVVYTSYWVEANLWGLARPAASHFINVLLHAANGVLVYSLLRLVLGRGAGALLGALLFVVHPLQVEPACWITGRKDMLLGFFSLLAIRLYLDFSRRRRTWSYAVASLSLILALLSKPAAVSVPLVAVAIEWFFFRAPLRRTALAMLSWLVVCAAIVVLTKEAQPVREEYVPVLSLWQRLLVACDTLTFYAGKLCWPRDMVPIYGRTPLVALQSKWIYATLLVPVLLAIAFWRGGREVRAGITIVLAVLLPVLGIVPFGHQWISTVADRYMYIAMLGVGLIAGHFVRRAVAARRPAPAATCIAAVVVLAALGVVTNHQQQYWRESITLWEHSLQIAPKVPTATYNLGEAYTAAGRRADSLEMYRRTVELDPRHTKGHNNLGNDLLAYSIEAERAGRQDEADRLLREAIEHYHAVLERIPNYAQTHANLALAYSRIDDLDKVIYHFERTEPDEAPYSVNNDFGNALFKRGDLDRAEEQYRLALAKAPGLVPAQTSLATLQDVRMVMRKGAQLEESGLRNEALALYERLAHDVPWFRPGVQAAERLRRQPGEPLPATQPAAPPSPPE